MTWYLPTADDRRRYWRLERADWDPAEHPRDPDGKFGDGAPGGGRLKVADVKVGQRLQFARGTDHQTGKTVEDFRGSVARKSPDGRLMINAGTKTKPRWVVAHVDDARPPAKAKPRATGESKKTYKSRLSPDEVKAIDAYMGENYRSINGTLREGRDPSPVTARRIALLDSAVSKGVLETDTTLYRAGWFDQPPPGEMVGKTFTDHGFVSTSEKTQLPLMMAASRRGGVYMRIKVPAATNAGYLNRHRNQQATSKYSGVPEDEVLLPRGTTFRVTAARQGGDGMWTVDVEVVPDD